MLQKPRRVFTTHRIGSLMMGFLFLGLAASASALTIRSTYDPTAPGAIDPCDGPQPACANGVDRTSDLAAIIGAAAASWADIIEDPGTLDIRYWWIDPGVAPSANVTSTDASGRPTAGVIRIPAGTWFYDFTPDLDEEYAMVSRLYRDVHPAELTEAFEGSLPETLEVGYNGFEFSDLATDLLTVVLHEMGHVVGLSGRVWSDPPASCVETASGALFELDPSWIGGRVGAIRAYQADNGDYDCDHLAVGGIKACASMPIPGQSEAVCEAHQALMWFALLGNDARSRPGTVDILSVAQAAGWAEIDLPRKFAVDSGRWFDSASWIGARVPDAIDDIFLVNRERETRLEIDNNAVARNVFVSDGNDLRVLVGRLDVGRSLVLRGDGSTITVDVGSRLTANDIELDSDALLRVRPAGEVEVVGLANGGRIDGAGVVIASTLVNTGLVSASEGDLRLRSDGSANPFDLDGAGQGTFAAATIHALAGNVWIDAPVLDAFGGEIRVGEGRLLAFDDAWGLDAMGQLSLEGDVAPARILAPAAALEGTTVVSGFGRFDSALDLEQTSRLTLEVAGLEAGAEHSQLQVDDRVELGGALTLRVAEGFVPAVGDEWVLVVANEVVGTFDQVEGTRIGSRLLQLHYRPDRVLAVAVDDCNRNSLDDLDDIATGRSEDRNMNGEPDECEVGRVTWVFDGMAAGGQIDITIDGWDGTCMLSVPTVAGESGEMVAANVAVTLSVDPCLVDQGITAVADGNHLILEGLDLSALDVGYTTTDPGLSHHTPITDVPMLSPVALAVFSGLLIVLMWRRSLLRG